MTRYTTLFITSAESLLLGKTERLIALFPGIVSRRGRLGWSVVPTIIRLKRILYPTDFSDFSLHAVKYAQSASIQVPTSRATRARAVLRHGGCQRCR